MALTYINYCLIVVERWSINYHARWSARAPPSWSSPSPPTMLMSSTIMKIPGTWALSIRARRMWAQAWLGRLPAEMSWSCKSSWVKMERPSNAQSSRPSGAVPPLHPAPMRQKLSRAWKWRRPSRSRTPTSQNTLNCRPWSCTAQCWLRRPLRKLYRMCSLKKLIDATIYLIHKSIALSSAISQGFRRNLEYRSLILRL